MISRTCWIFLTKVMHLSVCGTLSSCRHALTAIVVKAGRVCWMRKARWSRSRSAGRLPVGP